MSGSTSSTDIHAPIAAWPSSASHDSASRPPVSTTQSTLASSSSPSTSTTAPPQSPVTPSTSSAAILVPVNHPPTPAPSPRPSSLSHQHTDGLDSLSDPISPEDSDEDEELLITQARFAFERMKTSGRRRFLSEILAICPVEHLLHVSSLIAPRLKRDFLRELPIEVALHILSFIEEPRTLLRAACVSKYWNTLLSDEYTWKNMCIMHNFRPSKLNSTLPLYRAPAAALDGSGESSVNTSPRPRSLRRISSDCGDWEGGDALEPSGMSSEDATVPRFVYRALQSRTRSGGSKGKSTRATTSTVTAAVAPTTTATVATAARIESSEQRFSFRKHYRQSYLTDFNWRQGGCVLRSHTSPDEGVVTSVAMDDEWIVVGLANQNIHIFSTRTGKLHRSLEGHTLGVWALHLVSKGGEPLGPSALPSAAAGSSSSGDTADSAAWRRYTSGVDSSESLSSNSSYYSCSMPSSGAASPSLDPGRTGSAFGYLKQSDVCNSSLGWGQEGAIAVTAGCDREVRVWDVRSGYCLHVLKGHGSTIRCIKVLDGRPIAVTGSRDQTLRVWDIQRGRLMHVLHGHSNSVRALEVFGNYAISGSYDATAKMWNVDTGECLKTFEGHQHQVYAVAFDGVRVATGSLDSTVRLWSPETGTCLAILQGHTSLVGQLQLRGDSLVTGGSDGRAIVFSLATQSTLHRLCAHDNSITCLQFDDRFLITGGSDGHVKLFELKTGQLIRELTEPCDAVWRVNFKEDTCVIMCKRAGKTVVEILSFRPED